MRPADTFEAHTDRHEASRIPGLDGLRGIAVVMVVLFHFHEPSLPGGFLGVSLFFTLSGYLITGTLLRELGATGCVDLTRFYMRRVRRLVPASVLCIAVVTLTWHLSGWGDVSSSAMTAVLQIHNWSSIATDQPYGAQGASPLGHFWSLSIEEQFYWVLPLLVICCRRPRRLQAAGFVLLCGSLIAVWWSAGDPVRAYYSTLTRSGEILVGVLIASFTHGRRRRVSSLGVRPRLSRTDVLAFASLLLLVSACRVLSLDSLATYRGALLAASVASGVLVHALAAGGRSAALIDNRVCLYLGQRSYGIYLIHVPALAGVRAAGLQTLHSVVAATAITVVGAAVSYQLVEQPLRRCSRGNHPLVITFASAALVIALAVWVPPRPVPSGDIDFVAAQSTYDRWQSQASERPAEGADEYAAPDRGQGLGQTTEMRPASAGTPTTYVINGDSKAISLALSSLHLVDPPAVNIGGRALLGCPLGRGGRMRENLREGRGVDVTHCDWTGHLAANAAAHDEPADVALMYYGTWDIVERMVGRSARWTSIDDLDYRQWLLAEMRAASDELLERGVGVVCWLTLAATEGRSDLATETYNSLIRWLAASDPDRIKVIRLGEWFGTRADIDTLLPDGVHTTFGSDGGPDSGLVVFEEFLLDQIMNATN